LYLLKKLKLKREKIYYSYLNIINKKMDYQDR
jgi:hypothetical protein